MTGAAAAILLLCGGHAALAESLICDLRADCARSSLCAEARIEIRFSIDRNQFAPAIDPAEPPRRKVTQVTRGSDRFQAEPILLETGVRGFWTDDPASGSQVLTLVSDGAAIYTAPDGSGWSGHCRETG